ncbi:ImmA/IrrE family metallo-endopeptidase [Candidatus Kaiserbacteria bacterium]|nr:ImmA/IrrE family metallo-endopeptidase [Candidatus Kaiserbacteria bacterium]
MEPTNDRARIGSARILARDLIKRCKIKEPPVSLGSIIILLQRTHDLNLYPAVDFSDRLSAILVTVEDESVSTRRDEIHFNENHSWHRRRFSIAHEIGHLLFNTTCNQTGVFSYDASSPNETEANAFASELLMPLSFLKADFKRGAAQVPELAWRYIVSKEAMGWKIASTNLLTRV